MGFDHKGRVIADSGFRAFRPFYYDVTGAIVQRVPTDMYGRIVYVPISAVTFFSFNDGAETGELTIDAAHGHVLKCSSTGGREATLYNADAPSSEWDSLHPPDSDPDETIVVPGLFVEPNGGDPNVATRNLMYQVF